jgi:hypothetical protein
MLDTSYGFNNLLKEVPLSLFQGHKHFSGFEEVVLKNINACKEICSKIKRSLGPFGKRRLEGLSCGRGGSRRSYFRAAVSAGNLNLFKSF